MTLDAFAHAIPSVRHTAADLAALTGGEESFIVNKIGLSTRYVLGPGENGVTLSRDACRALFAKHPGVENEIDLLVCVTQNPDRKLPQNSAAIAAELGLPKSIASFDIALGCSGYVYGVSIVEGFLAATGGKTALLVTCDPYSRIIEPSDKDTNAVFGDAATVTLIRKGGRGKIIATDFGTDGSGGDAICVPGGGAAKPQIGAAAVPLTDADLRLYMKGRDVFNFVNSVVPQSIKACLEKASLGVADIDFFALHQGSIYMLDAMAKRVGIPPEKVLKNMERYGNTVSSSIPLLLSEQDAAGQLAGKRVLMSGFGVGLSWATAIVEF
ncbi:MAG: ketoacyl-ACP synthase III [Hyphomonadaceae bacterium]|nr:ketoacyl-ACP synthase III [Hyphomonadaceae bacterium]